MKVTGANLTRRAGDTLGIELQSDSGLIGVALADAATRTCISRLVTDLVEGADPSAVTGLWQTMQGEAPPNRRSLTLRRAIAALDVALWDLKAKANDEPLWKTLGGARPRANAYASCRNPRLADDELSAWFHRMARDHGLRGGKLRASPDRESNLRRLGLMHGALRRAAGAPALMLDIGAAWQANETIDSLLALERHFDLTWVEHAAHDRDWRRLKRISHEVSAAICVGGDLAAVADFRPHFEQRSVDVVQIDIRTVGITGALMIADAAFGLELPVALAAAPGNIQAQLAGVMPGFMTMEVVDPAEETATCATSVRIEEGWGVAGDAPGNGLVLR